MPKLYEVHLDCDKGGLRAISPLDISGGNIGEMGEALIFHAGMGKPPEKLAHLMESAAEDGFIPIGIDTRTTQPDPDKYGLSLDKRTRQQQLELRANPELTDEATNTSWYALRRVIALEEAMDQLKVAEKSFVAHSDGTRICALAAWRSPELVNQLVLVNPVGLGDSWHAYRRLFRSNLAEIKAAALGEIEAVELVMGGIKSAVYAVRDPRRAIQEKRVIQASFLWPVLDQLQKKGIDISILMAEGDHLVSFDKAYLNALNYPDIKFIPTPGRHTNIYDHKITDLVSSQL